jgi:hypothetical protein
LLTIYYDLTKKTQVIVDMSLSNQDIESLKKKLNNNKNLSPRSKTNLNAFINSKKNAFDSSTFMRQYNAKMRNLRSRDASIGNREMSSNNLNSAMEINRGNVSGRSVNPKRGRNSPRGPLSGVSGVSNTSNNENNVSSKKARFMTAAMGAQRAIANANAKAAANKAKAEANERREVQPRMNLKEKKRAAAIKANANAKAKANANAKARANANAKAKANANAKARANANAKAKANANAKARANANAKAKANANANAKARANANAKARAKANANTKANSARVSATTLGTPNQSLNNNGNSDPIIKPANRRNSKEKEGKLMKGGILLEIIKQAGRTASMKKLNNLKKLNTRLNSPNSIKEYDTYAWALLYDMIKGLPDTKFEGMQVNRKTLKQVHEKLRQKNAYSSGRTSGGEGNRRIFIETFNDDEIVEFMLLIWLDGSHDAYITSSFLDWIDSPTCEEYFHIRHRNLAKNFVKEFPNPKNINDTFKRNPIKFKNFKTELFKKIKGYDTIRKICIETEAIWFFIHEYNPGTSKRMIDKVFNKDKKPSLSGNFEAELKLGMKEILNTRQTNEIYSGGAINNLKRNGQKIVSLDMETGGDILSEAIRNTPDFRPYITVANLIDPGKHMIKTSAGSKDAQLVLSVMQSGRVDLLDKLKCQYYIGPLNFTIMDKIKTKNGKNNSLPFFKINLSIDQGGPPITKEGRVPTLDFFNLNVNGKKVLQGTTAFDARNGPSKPRAKNFTIKKPEAKMGKFMGDALQYMVVAIQNKYRGRERYFASGDGSACFMYVYFCNKLNIKPKLIIDKGDERIRTIGLRNN